MIYPKLAANIPETTRPGMAIKCPIVFSTNNGKSWSDVDIIPPYTIYKIHCKSLPNKTYLCKKSLLL